MSKKLETISEHKLKHSYWQNPIIESDGSIWCAICGVQLKKDIELKVFELWDIFEELTDRNIKENIEYVLKRERIWQKGMSIVFPQGSLSIRNYDDGFYQQDFEVFAEDMKTILYNGTAYGSFSVNITNIILDMTVEIKEVNVKVVN